MPEDSIKVYDTDGRELRISRAEWVKKVLPHSLQRAWNDPDALHAVIEMAVRDGFSSQVVDASARLVQLEPDAERTACMRAAVQMKEGEWDGAERTLKAHLRSQGETPAVLTHLSKIYSWRGEDSRARELLRQALKLNPNFGKALEGWGHLHAKEGGHPAFEAAMVEISKEPSAWRPHLWLARKHLERDELPQAVRLYRQVLTRAGGEPDALTQISGDLGSAGHVGEVPALIGELYDPLQHGPYAGMNLAQAFLQLGRYREARDTLEAVKSLNVSTLMSSLDALTTEIHNAQRFAN